MIYRSTLAAHEWKPPVPDNLKYIIDNSEERCSFLQNTPKFLNFLNEVNLMIINTPPVSKGLFTRFMDNSGRPGTRSLIDYGLIDQDHASNVTSFIIDKEARYDCGTDHALLECNVQFGFRPKVSWSFSDALQYDLKENTSYTEYQSNLDLATSTIPLTQFISMAADQMLPHISESITSSAKKTFGLKIKKKKCGRKLPREVISKIKTKNTLARKISLSPTLYTTIEIENMKLQLDTLKLQIKDSIFEFKLHRRHHLRSKLLRADPSRKKFWRFLKNQIQSAGNISAAYNKSGQMVFDQHEIEEAVLHHFSTVFKGKRCPVFPLESSSPQVDLAILEIDQILRQTPVLFKPDQFEEEICTPYSFLELTQILDKLPSGKASGYDKINNELLKNASDEFKQYLMIFLNKVMEDGVVPPDLNLGKCMLIHKVMIYSLLKSHSYLHI